MRLTTIQFRPLVQNLLRALRDNILNPDRVANEHPQ
jgi:hypothetical protein